MVKTANNKEIKGKVEKTTGFKTCFVKKSYQLITI